MSLRELAAMRVVDFVCMSRAEEKYFKDTEPVVQRTVKIGEGIS